MLNGNLLLMRRISLDYFCHHQGFVFTRADSNLFVTQLIMREINSSRHHVFVPLCGTLNTIKFIWEVETHVGDKFFQFNYRWILKLSYNPHLPSPRAFNAKLTDNPRVNGRKLRYLVWNLCTVKRSFPSFHNRFFYFHDLNLWLKGEFVGRIEIPITVGV